MIDGVIASGSEAIQIISLHRGSVSDHICAA